MIETVIDQLTGVVFFLLAGILGVLGFLAESTGFQTILENPGLTGVWEVGIGIIMLVAWAKLMREEVLPRLGLLAED